MNEGKRPKLAHTHTHAQTLLHPSSLCSTLLHNLMRHHGYAACIYSGLFVFAGVEFGWMAEVIPGESHFNHIRTSEQDQIHLFVMPLSEDSMQSQKGHNASRHNSQSEEVGGWRLDHREDGMEREQENVGNREPLIAHR